MAKTIKKDAPNKAIPKINVHKQKNVKKVKNAEVVE